MIGIRNIVLNNTIYATAGVIGVASMSIMFSTLSVVDAIVTSIIQSFTMISSVCVGERNSKDLKHLVGYVLKIVWPLLLCFVVLQSFLAKPICSLFSTDEKCIEFAALATRLYLPSVLLEVISDILINLYTIYGHKYFTNFFSIIHYFVVQSSFAVITQSLIGYYSVFCGYVFTEIVCFIVILVFVMCKNKSINISIKNLILENLFFKDVKKCSISIDSIDKIGNVSQDISSFCKDNNIDTRRSYLSGLCVEETIVNIFEHGFTKKEIKHKNVDVFALVENNDVTIRIRDNSVPFNPETRLTVFNPEDPCKNIGIRTISKISKEMTYQSIFGFNSLIIKV